MIVDAVFGALTTAVATLMGLLPTLPALPSWFSLGAGDTIGGHAQDIGQYMAFGHAWVNLSPVLGAMPYVITLLGVIVLVRLFRWAFSAFTGGGGGGVSG